MFAGIPLLWFFVKPQRPEYYGLLPDGAEIEPGSKAETGSMIDKGVEYAAGFQEMEFTLRQAMRTPVYWMLILAYLGQSIVYGGFNIHCIPFLTDMGIDPALAGGMMAMMVFFRTPARFLGGFLVDRIRKDRLQFLLAGTYVIQIAGIIIFLLNPSIATTYIFLIMYGFGSGAPTALYILIRGRYFGRKAYGSIAGTSSMFAAPIALLAPVYTGWIYDTTCSYVNAFILFVAVMAFSMIIACLIRPPKPPARITDIRQFV